MIVFSWSTQQGWSLAVDLVIGPKGIRQRTKADSTVSNFINIWNKMIYEIWTVTDLFLSCSIQPVFLAEYKQIRNIKYNTQTDGRTLLLIEIEGARQVRKFSL